MPPLSFRTRLELRDYLVTDRVVAPVGTAAPWSSGERVVTPNGFIAEILSLTTEHALIRYLSVQPDPEIQLPLALLRPATAHDLFLAGINGKKA